MEDSAGAEGRQLGGQFTMFTTGRTQEDRRRGGREKTIEYHAGDPGHWRVLQGSTSFPTRSRVEEDSVEGNHRLARRREGPGPEKCVPYASSLLQSLLTKADRAVYCIGDSAEMIEGTAGVAAVQAAVYKLKELNREIVVFNPCGSAGGWGFLGGDALEHCNPPMDLQQSCEGFAAGIDQ